MQGSTSFDWGRIVTVLRWIARIFAGAIILAGSLLGGIGIAIAIGNGSFVGQLSENPMEFVLPVGVGVGLLLAIFWRGVGELVGGLIAVGAAVGLLIVQGAGAIGSLPSLGLTGVLFIICGWYTLAQRRRPASPATA